MQRNCEHCGEPFEAKRERARYCGGSCRAKAAQKRQRTGVQVASVEPEQGDVPPLVREVAEALASANKTGWRAQQAVTLAERLATRGETGAAALSKELDRLMGELLAGVVVETDDLDKLTENVVPMRRRRA